MRELSLHILDIVQNSVKAGANLIEIEITEDIPNNLLLIKVKDNGGGMAPEFLGKVKDPFITTRMTRKVGLGISLFEAAANACGGGLEISSQLGKGTVLEVRFEHNHIDRVPLGDIVTTLVTLIASNPQIDWVYRHIVNGDEFVLDTREVRERIGEIPLDHPMVIDFINEYIADGLKEINFIG